MSTHEVYLSLSVLLPAMGAGGKGSEQAAARYCCLGLNHDNTLQQSELL